MEYKKDLLALPEKSNKFQVVIGIIFLVISILPFVVMVLGFQAFEQYSWIDRVFYGVFGIVQLLMGLGFSIGKFFGKAFIDIDSDRMKFKLGILEKEKIFNWKDITAIDYKPNTFTISQGNSAAQVIKVSTLDYSSISEIKEVISKIAATKEVKYGMI